MEEVIEVLRLADPQCDAKLPQHSPRLRPLQRPARRELRREGRLRRRLLRVGGEDRRELVQIESLYKDRATLDPHHAEHKDVYARMLRMANKLREAKGGPYIRLEGCPVSIGELIIAPRRARRDQEPVLRQPADRGVQPSYLTWRGRRSGSACAASRTRCRERRCAAPRSRSWPSRPGSSERPSRHSERKRGISTQPELVCSTRSAMPWLRRPTTRRKNRIEDRALSRPTPRRDAHEVGDPIKVGGSKPWLCAVKLVGAEARRQRARAHPDAPRAYGARRYAGGGAARGDRAPHAGLRQSSAPPTPPVIELKESQRPPKGKPESEPNQQAARPSLFDLLKGWFKK